MANILSDGTVVPSFLPVDSGQESQSVSGDNDYSLKIGTVVKIHYPGDPGNIRKNRIEYDVKVSERQGQKGFNINLYPNCIVANLFGGIADSLEWTYRPTVNPNVLDAQYLTGSQVLILCIHGDTNGGVIVGGNHNPKRGTVSERDRGHFLEFEFNGINVEINKDGEITLTYRSRTDIHGAPQDTASAGSYIKIDKTGSLEISDAVGDTIKIDKPTAKISEVAQSNWMTNAPNMKVGGDGANEQLVLGNTFMAFYNQMVKIFNNHTHREHDWAPNPLDPPFGYVTKKPTSALKTISTKTMSKAQLSDFVFTKKKYQR